MNGKEQEKCVNAGVKKKKIVVIVIHVVIEPLVTSNSTVLNNKLNWGGTDWNKERQEIKLLLSKSKTIKCNLNLETKNVGNGMRTHSVMPIYGSTGQYFTIGFNQNSEI